MAALPAVDGGTRRTGPPAPGSAGTHTGPSADAPRPRTRHRHPLRLAARRPPASPPRIPSAPVRDEGDTDGSRTARPARVRNSQGRNDR